MTTSSHIVTCDISTVSLLTEDILLIDIQEEKDFRLKDFWQLYEAAKAIGKGRKFYNLVLVGKHTLPSHKAREASTSKEGSIFKMADAFVIHSQAQRFVVNFYMNFHKPYVRTRFFNDRARAESWLNELIEQDRKIK